MPRVLLGVRCTETEFLRPPRRLIGIEALGAFVLRKEAVMSMVKKLLQSLWGVNEPDVDLTPAIDCEPCRVARLAGKDACVDHRTHHDATHPKGARPEEFLR